MIPGQGGDEVVSLPSIIFAVSTTAKEGLPMSSITLATIPLLLGSVPSGIGAETFR